MRDDDAQSPGPDAGGRDHAATVAVVFNPSTGGDQARTRREEVQAALAAAGAAWTWSETTPQDDGGGLVGQALAGGAGLVIACGGDGTVRACAAALAGTQVPLAVLPAGTGNLVAANFDLPDTLPQALETALTGTTRRIDLGALTTGEQPAGRFVAMAGIGLDAAMIRDAPRPLKTRLGLLAYAVSAVRNLRRPRCRVRLQMDDAAPVRRVVQGVLIGNLGRLQAGVTALPDAVPDDGLLDVAVVKARRWRDWAGMAARAIARRPQARSMVEFHQARRVEITCDRPQPIQQDGELLPHTRHLVAEVLPQAVLLVVPDQHDAADPQH